MKRQKKILQRDKTIYRSIPNMAQMLKLPGKKFKVTVVCMTNKVTNGND